MSDQPPSQFECAEAQLAVEAAWLSARKSSTAREDLLALEMMIQGFAVLKKVMPKSSERISQRGDSV